MTSNYIFKLVDHPDKELEDSYLLTIASPGSDSAMPVPLQGQDIYDLYQTLQAWVNSRFAIDIDANPALEPGTL